MRRHVLSSYHQEEGDSDYDSGDESMGGGFGHTHLRVMRGWEHQWVYVSRRPHQCKLTCN